MPDIEFLPTKKAGPFYSTRFLFLDSIRGIAALLVLVQHLCGIVFPVLTKEITYSYISLGQTGVVAFFMVSGFIIPFSLERSKSIQDFFINRIFRIYPLYIFVIFIQLGLLFLPPENGIKDISLTKIFLTHLVFIQEYIPYSSAWSENLVLGSWTLFIEFIWYILVVALFWLNIPHSRLMISSVIIFSILILTSFLSDFRIPLGKIAMLYNCILGLHIYRWSIGSMSGKQFLVLLIPALSIIFSGLWLAYGYFASGSFTIVSVITSWISAYVIFGLFFLFKSTGNLVVMSFLGFLGKISYSIYLTHFSILTLVLHFWGNSSLTFIITFVLSILFSTFTYYVIEKPGIALGKQIIRNSEMKPV